MTQDKTVRPPVYKFSVSTFDMELSWSTIDVAVGSDYILWNQRPGGQSIWSLC